MLPAADRLGGNGLADLYRAGRPDYAAGLEKAQAALVPIKAAKAHEVAADCFLVLDEIFVRDLVNRHGQHALPVSHQLFVGSIVRADLFQGPREVDVIEILEIAGNADV